MRNFLLTFYCINQVFWASAQIDIDSLSRESPYGPFTTRYFTEEQVQYNDTNFFHLDTIPNNFQRFDMVSVSNYQYQNLGNFGTALHPYFYSTPVIIGKTSGFNSYRPYFKTPDKTRYFDTRSPYSSVKVLFGGENRSIVDVEFSRNITPGWNLGFSVKAINADKQINSSGEGDRNTISWAYDFFTSYKSNNGRYHVLGNISRLRHRVMESGGIVPPEIDPTSELFGYNDNAKIWLSTAESSQLLVNLHLYHQYKINSAFHLYHIFDQGRELDKYDDTNLSTSSDYYDYFLFDDGETFDEQELKILNNEFGIKGNIDHLFFKGYTRIKSLKYRHKYLPDEDKDVEKYLGGEVRYKVNDSLFVKFSAEYMLGGNYKLEGFTESKWWHLRFISTKYQAPYLVNNYFGNHREWHNQFTSSRAQTFEGALKLNLGSFNFYPSISFATLNGFIYFDNDKLPVQADNDITMIIPGVDMNIRFLKHMHFNNQVKYTLKGGGAADVYRVPEIHANAKLYFEKNIFNKVMWAQIGLDMHWQSSFYAYDYDPVVQQFYLQDDFEIPSYLLADLFISFKVKRFRWAFKMNNVLQNLEAEGYFTTPYYTGQKRTFDFAVNWMFFD